MYPGQSATVFVTFAITGGTPTAVNMGKVMSVPPPAIEFTNPPPTAARQIRISSHPVIVISTRSFSNEQAGIAARPFCKHFSHVIQPLLMKRIELAVKNALILVPLSACLRI
jgi:hypothetical protein